MLWYLAVGSAIGGTCRYLLGGALQRPKFPAFSYETTAMIEAGGWARAGTYVGLSVALSLGSTVLGFAAVREPIGNARP